MSGDVSTEAPAYAAALEQYTDPSRWYMYRGIADRLEALDAERTWENEGGQ